MIVYIMVKKKNNKSQLFSIILFIFMILAFSMFIRWQSSNYQSIKYTYQDNKVKETVDNYKNPDLSEKQIFNLVNDLRRAQGLNELKWNNNLHKSASDKAENMCEEQYWAHVSPSGKTPWDFILAETNYDTAGENLGKDFFDEKSLVQSWMSSTSHKENILNNKYTEAAVVVFKCKYRGINTQLVVQHFMSPFTNTVEKNVVDPDTPVHCNVHADCGGGTIPLTQSECENSTCCQMKDGSWKFYVSKQQCLDDQKNGM